MNKLSWYPKRKKKEKKQPTYLWGRSRKPLPSWEGMNATLGKSFNNFVDK